MDVLDGINIFDFIAFLLHELGEEAAARYAGLESRTIVPAEECIRIADQFIDDIKEYYAGKEGRSDIDQIRRHVVDEGIPRELYEAYCGNDCLRKNKDAVFYLVKKIAASMLTYDILLYVSQKEESLERLRNRKEGHRKNGFSQLNSDDSVKETGYIILPDLGTFGDERNINYSTTKYEKIYLKGLIVLTLDDLRTRNGQTYEVRNILPPVHSHLREYPQDGRLVIAVSPIHRDWLLNDQPRIEINPINQTREYLFECDGVTDEELITERVKAAYETASRYGAWILLFPEMYGTVGLSTDAAKKIGFFTDRHVPLVVLPSWWHDNKNTAPVLNDALIQVFSQAKHSPFVYDDKRKKEKYQEPSKENLKNTDHIVYLYHIPKVGRLCVCVCKDFLMDSYRRMLSESLEASFILIPAFSPEIDQFTNCMGELRHAGTYGVLVNCCAAFYAGLSDVDSVHNHAVGAVSLTKPARSDSDLSPARLLMSSCSGNCRAASCLFIITITDEGFVHIEHVIEDNPVKEGK